MNILCLRFPEWVLHARHIHSPTHLHSTCAEPGCYVACERFHRRGFTACGLGLRTSISRPSHAEEHEPCGHKFNVSLVRRGREIHHQHAGHAQGRYNPPPGSPFTYTLGGSSFYGEEILRLHARHAEQSRDEKSTSSTGLPLYVGTRRLNSS
jgi:hypothetical protein